MVWKPWTHWRVRLRPGLRRIEMRMEAWSSGGRSECASGTWRWSSTTTGSRRATGGKDGAAGAAQNKNMTNEDKDRLHRTDENMFKLLFTERATARQQRRLKGTWDWHLRMFLMALLPSVCVFILEYITRTSLKNNEKWQTQKARLGLGDPLKFERRVLDILGNVEGKSEAKALDHKGTAPEGEIGEKSKQPDASAASDDFSPQEVERIESLRSDLMAMWKEIERLERLFARLTDALSLQVVPSPEQKSQVEGSEEVVASNRDQNGADLHSKSTHSDRVDKAVPPTSQSPVSTDQTATKPLPNAVATTQKTHEESESGPRDGEQANAAAARDRPPGHVDSKSNADESGKSVEHASNTKIPKR